MQSHRYIHPHELDTSTDRLEKLIALLLLIKSDPGSLARLSKPHQENIFSLSYELALDALHALPQADTA